MIDFFTKNETKDDKLEDICEVYLLYFDESKGPIPILIYPDESIKNNPEKMRLINIHPIWFLDIKKHENFNRIDLEYEGKMFFAKKFFVNSKRKKKRAGLGTTTPETIILIIALSNDIDLFGNLLLNKITEAIITNFGSNLYQVIESEIVKYNLVKTPKLREIVTKGDYLKMRLSNLIKKICNEFFLSFIEQIDATSIKLQKALSYFMLKGIFLNKRLLNREKKQFSITELFESTKNDINKIGQQTLFKFMNFKIIQDSSEIEIKVKNISKKFIENLRTKITYVKEFFEDDLLNEKIDYWHPEEEILIIFPIIPGISDYIFYIIGNADRNILFSKKIEIRR
ncbi:MAG: hypothetical protein ACFE8A_10590 [Candidatus Hodarchaeota archaeon]